MTSEDIADAVTATPFARCRAIEGVIREARDALCGDRGFLISFIVFDMEIGRVKALVYAEAGASWIDNDFWRRP